jgi:thioredoxin-like negative regulator of GroEL
MSVPPPASPLITPDLRRRLQQRYEEAVRLLNQPPVDHARVHELLAECLRADPGNILYLNAMLANLRRWSRGSGDWLRGWFSRQLTNPRVTQFDRAVLRTQYFTDEPVNRTIAIDLLQDAPELLRRSSFDPNLFLVLAAACSAVDLDQTEIRYLHAALDAAPVDRQQAMRMLARTLTRNGQFGEAQNIWNSLLALAPDAEVRQAVDDLMAADNYESADRRLAEAGAAAGEDLAIRREREELRLAHSEQHLAIARRRAASDKHAKAQSLVSQLEAELLRQEIEILHLRCERLPGDVRLRLELAQKLKQAGNYSGAIQRLEEARGDASLTAEVQLELGECWQHLRQFEKAIDYYRQAIATEQPRSLLAALYRMGVLASAMGKTSEAREALTRLVEMDPGYKDARERLDKLPAN